MVKDRIGALKAALNESYEANNDVNINMDGGEGFLSEFFNEVEEISQSLDKIVATVEEVKKKHSAILSAPSTDEKNNQILESLMAEIKSLSGKVKQKLKSMAHVIEQEEQGNMTSSALRIKKTQHSALTRRFVSAMTDYNTIQTDYRQRCKDRIKRQLEITGNVKTDTEIEEMLEGGDFAVFTQGIVVETQKARQTLADIEDRHADIMKLEKSIREIHQMFLDMAVLVESQGELIDRIEYNVQNAADFVDSGKTNLNTAIKYRDKARKKKIILGIIALVLLIIIIGIILGYTVK